MSGGFLHKPTWGGHLGWLEVFYTSMVVTSGEWRFSTQAGVVTSGDWRFSTQAPGGQLGWLEVFYTSVVVATMCVES